MQNLAKRLANCAPREYFVAIFFPLFRTGSIMARANEIKKGMVLNYNGKLLIVKNIDIQSPSARGAATLYKMRFADVRTGMKVEERFKGDDIVDTVTLTRRFVDFSYVDGNEYVFMDKEDYTPYIFTKEQIEEELQFMPQKAVCRICRF